MIVEYKNSIVILVLFFCILTGQAQDDVFMIQQKGILSFSPVYQSWADESDNRFSEFSIPLSFSIPLANDFSMSLNSGQASVNGDGIENLSGITDTQINFNYYWRDKNIIFNLGMNLPTGKNELTLEEFHTSYLISLDMYDFKVPNFGQGFNLSPGISWAIPFSDQIVGGAGLSYQFKGAFSHFADVSGEYDPGDELLITAGLDFRLDETSNLSADLIFTCYGVDKLDGVSTYQAGSKFVISTQYRKYFGYDDLRIFMQYKSRGKNEVGIAGGLIAETEKTIPNQFSLSGRYRKQLQSNVYGSAIIEGHFFQETKIYNKTSLIIIGVMPEFILSQTVKIPLKLNYRICSVQSSSNFSGLEIGAGVQYIFEM